MGRCKADSILTFLNLQVRRAGNEMPDKRDAHPLLRKRKKCTLCFGGSSQFCTLRNVFRIFILYLHMEVANTVEKSPKSPSFPQERYLRPSTYNLEGGNMEWAPKWYRKGGERSPLTVCGPYASLVSPKHVRRRD